LIIFNQAKKGISSFGADSKLKNSIHLTEAHLCLLFSAYVLTLIVSIGTVIF